MLSNTRTRVVAVLCLVITALSTPADATEAGGTGSGTCGHLTCDVQSNTPGSPGTPDSENDDAKDTETAAAGNDKPTGPPPCTGITKWDEEINGAFAGVAEPQPPKSHPVWGGHHPEGAVYVCETRRYDNSFLTTVTGLYWAPEPPDAEPPDPEVLAQEAIDKLEFDLPQIATTLDDPGNIGYVGSPVWLWLANPGASTLGPLRASAAAGGNDQWRVSVVARLDRFEWDMGDGTTVTCHGPGTPYQESFADREPECGHVYTTQGDPHTITLRAFYQVTWSGLGDQDVIEHELPPQTAQIRVGELQVLSQ